MTWLVIRGARCGGGVACCAGASRRVRKEHGSAQWLKPWTAARKRLFNLSGIPLGDWGWWYLPVRFNEDGHILTVAPPGGGKSTHRLDPERAVAQHPKPALSPTPTRR